MPAEPAALPKHPPVSLAPIAITMGEPAGIGPEQILKLYYLHPPQWPCVIIADLDWMVELNDRLSYRLTIQAYNVTAYASASHEQKLGQLWVVNVPTSQTVVSGQLAPNNAETVLACLDHAIDGCLKGEYRAMVTAPLHKGVINDAGYSFTGHTEYLASRSNAPMPVMMLATELPDGKPFRVALVTTHLPLSEVSQAITPSRLEQVLNIVHESLIHQGQAPRMLVTGLNPHAGESGHLGREEIEIIEPVIEAMRQQQKKVAVDIDGPLPADTLFTPDRLQQCDVVVAMYHDQGLPVLKHVGFGKAVNITLGLPFIRTSVDHGTALDIAGTGVADVESLAFAIEEAVRLSAVTTTTAMEHD